MGGGGGGRETSYSKSTTGINSQNLRREVKDSIRKTEKRLKSKESKITYPSRNVFISFHMADEMQVKLLRHQAKDNRFNFKFRDYSAKEAFKDPWKKYCREKIKQSSFTIVMIGEDTHKRPAVKWEIAESYRQGKEVIGIRMYRDENYKIPQQMNEKNAKIVNWNLGDIMEILSEASY